MKSSIDAPKVSSITISFEGEYRTQIDSLNETIDGLNANLDAFKKDLEEKDFLIREWRISREALKIIALKYGKALGLGIEAIQKDFLSSLGPAIDFVYEEYERKRDE